jgi:riboflavin synthase
MFTGIVQQLGTVAANKGRVLKVKAKFGKLPKGASVAINGTCLTMIARKGAEVTFDVGPETHALTNLGALRKGDRVNVETPLKAADFIGGHWVSGHVDACDAVLDKGPLPNGFVRMRFKLPKKIAPLVAPKGSVAIDGTSLTVTKTSKKWFEVMLIPETLENTTLGIKGPGDRVNLEADLMARYVENILKSRGR